MATKTIKTNTFAELINQADANAAIKAADARTELAELKDNVARWADEYEEAAGRVAWIKGNFSRGKEVVSPQEFAEALAAEERLKLLSGKGDANADWSEGDRRVKRAETNLPPAEKKLASAVASLLEGALPGITILSTFGRVDGIPAETDLPVAVVSQAKSTFDGTRNERDFKKTPRFPGLNISGDVEVTLYRKPMHRELYPPKLAKYLAKHGVQLHNAESLRNGDTMSRSTAEYDVDILRLSVDQMRNPDASPELIASYEHWMANRKTTLSESSAQTENAQSIYYGASFAR